MRLNSVYVTGLLCLLVLFSCSKKTESISSSLYLDLDAIIVCNKGVDNNLDAKKSTLSLYYPDLNEAVNDVYYSANRVDFQSSITSVSVENRVGYGVFKDMDKIYTFDPYSMKSIDSLEGFDSPQYIAFYENKGYVSCSNSVVVFNASTLTIEREIMTDLETDKILINNGYVYALNKGGKLLKIDIKTDEITVLEINGVPNSMTLDGDGLLWVLSQRDATRSASLTSINLGVFEKASNFNFIDRSNPYSLTINMATNELMWIARSPKVEDKRNGHVFSMKINDKNLPDTPLIVGEDKIFYYCDIDQQSGEIYVSAGTDSQENGDLIRYSADGLKKIDIAVVGVNPSFFLL